MIRLRFASILKTNNTNHPIHGNDQVKLVASGGYALHFAVDPVTKEGRVIYGEHGADVESSKLHALSSPNSIGMGMFRIQAFHKRAEQVCRLPSN